MVPDNSAFTFRETQAGSWCSAAGGGLWLKTTFPVGPRLMLRRLSLDGAGHGWYSSPCSVPPGTPTIGQARVSLPGSPSPRAK
jgi:hypothetical protein